MFHIVKRLCDNSVSVYDDCRHQNNKDGVAPCFHIVAAANVLKQHDSHLIEIVTSLRQTLPNIQHVCFVAGVLFL